jgi:hypothetical protein
MCARLSKPSRVNFCFQDRSILRRVSFVSAFSFLEAVVGTSLFPGQVYIGNLECVSHTHGFCIWCSQCVGTFRLVTCVWLSCLSPFRFWKLVFIIVFSCVCVHIYRVKYAISVFSDLESLLGIPFSHLERCVLLDTCVWVYVVIYVENREK